VTQRLTNPLIFIFVTRLLDAIGFGIVMPVLPKLLLSMGMPNVAEATRVSGLLLVTYAVLQFLFGPVIGNLSDRFGRRPVIMVSLFAYSLDYLLMGFAPTIAWLFAGRALAGIAGAVYIPATAFVADVTPPEQRARAFGLVGSAFGIGFILGPVVGGLFGELSPRAPFFAAAALAGINLVFGLLVLPESLPPEKRRAFSWRRATPLGAGAALTRYPELLAYVLVTFAFLVATAVYPSTWAFFLTARFDASTKTIGLSLAVTGVMMALVQAGLTGRVVSRVGEARAALIGLAACAAACVAHALAGQLWMIFIIPVIFGLQGLTYPSLTALLTRRAPADAQGELQGAIGAMSSVASIVGPLLMTQVLAFFTSPAAPLQFSGAALMLAGALNLTGFIVLLILRPWSALAPQPEIK
jgi:DHA1 family tetracycline resistance protein-like MFS transporter